MRKYVICNVKFDDKTYYERDRNMCFNGNLVQVASFTSDIKKANLFNNIFSAKIKLWFIELLDEVQSPNHSPNPLIELKVLKLNSI